MVPEDHQGIGPRGNDLLLNPESTLILTEAEIIDGGPVSRVDRSKVWMFIGGVVGVKLPHEVVLETHQVFLVFFSSINDLPRGSLAEVFLLKP